MILLGQPSQSSPKAVRRVLLFVLFKGKPRLSLVNQTTSFSSLILALTDHLFRNSFDLEFLLGGKILCLSKSDFYRSLMPSRDFSLLFVVTVAVAVVARVSAVRWTVCLLLIWCNAALARPRLRSADQTPSLVTASS